MELFFDQLTRLCTAHPTRAKWIFVPNHAIGRTIGDRLVLDGTDWANLRFVTPLDVALRMGAPFLVERGIDPSEEGLGPALAMRLLMGLPEGTSYFRPLANQPQMAMALWSTLRELRMAGVRSSDLTASAFASADKHAELRALIEAYEHFLADHARGDLATVYDEAVQHLDWCPITPQDCWTELPGVIWTPLQQRLIDLLPGDRITPVGVDVPGVTLPRRLAGARVDRPAADADVPLAFLMAPGQHIPDSPARRDPQVSFFHAGGPEAEIEEVFRRILSSGATLDDVEIACASPSYTTLIWEKACRYEWPVTLAAGLPATLTRPGRVLMGFTEWIEDDFAAGRLRRLLQSGDVTLGRDAALSPGRAARLLVKARAAWGRDTYRLSLARLSKSWRVRADRDDIPADDREWNLKRAGEADAFAAWTTKVVGSVPQVDQGGMLDLQALVTAAEQFLDDHAARASALDHAAAALLRGALAELRALGEFRCPPSQGLRFLRERVESLGVGADRPRPGHLHVSRLSHAAFSHRRRFFVVGLEEGRVFPAPFEDPILLDVERAAIRTALPQSTDRTDEAVHAVLTRLASASANPDVHISLSYSCRDLRQFRDTYASWLMLQAYRVVSGHSGASYQELHAHLATPKSCVPESPGQAPGLGRWWLHGVMRVGAEAGRKAVDRAYPALAAGAHAEAERASDRFTEFDGFVPAAGVVLDPSAADQIVSPTRLEGAAKCPYRFFLERGLQVSAIESGERDREVWLDPLLRGSLLHDLYAECMRRCRAAGRRPTLSEDREWFRNLGRQKLEDLQQEMPPPSVDVAQRETHDLLEDLDIFLRAECDADPARRPIGLEVSFGQPGAAEAEPLARPEPVGIRAGGLTFRLAGRVDRVDRIDRPGGPVFEIVDYKTGRYWADDWKGTFAGGRLLQHALYGLAVAELLRRAGEPGRMGGGEYYFSSEKGRQQRKVIPAPPLASVAKVLTDLRDVIATGAFVHAPTDAPCKFCHYTHACGLAAHERAAAKLGDPVLEPYRRLAAHE
jgi:ATP-dependent helicase/nuclease subunit B